MCVTGVFVLSDTYNVENIKIEATSGDSTILSHAGTCLAVLAVNEWGIAQERRRNFTRPRSFTPPISTMSRMYWAGPVSRCGRRPMHQKRSRGIDSSFARGVSSTCGIVRFVICSDAKRGTGVPHETRLCLIGSLVFYTMFSCWTAQVD